MRGVLSLLFPCIIALSACMTSPNVEYGSVTELSQAKILPHKKVWSRVYTAYYHHVPLCVDVQVSSRWPRETQKVIAQSLLRQSSLHFPQVMLYNSAIDTDWSGSRWAPRTVAAVQKSSCDYILLAEPWQQNEDLEVGFYVERNFGIAVQLQYKHQSKETLWQAYHITSRHQGGIPISPVGLAVNIVKAESLRHDTDIFPSLVDDAIRRVLVSLPILNS